MSEMPDFEGRLRSRGFRVTPGRMQILKILWRAKGPLTVDEIGKKLDLNVVTLYRALSDLAEQGLLMRGIGSGDIRAAHFSYRNHTHHHHLVCADCGFIKTCANCS